MTVWPWQWAVPGLVPYWVLFNREEERDANTEPEVPSGSATAAGFYQAWAWYRYRSVPLQPVNDSPTVLLHNERRQQGPHSAEECWTEEQIRSRLKHNA